MVQIFFNVIVDGIVRETKSVMNITDNDSIVYADDGLVTGTNRDAVQYCVDLITHLFALFGLQMNAAKTKALWVTKNCTTPNIYARFQPSNIRNGTNIFIR
jgi:Reverse transcriptase (RNA-dependent DNA polymerase)